MDPRLVPFLAGDICDNIGFLGDDTAAFENALLCRSVPADEFTRRVRTYLKRGTLWDYHMALKATALMHAAGAAVDRSEVAALLVLEGAPWIVSKRTCVLLCALVLFLDCVPFEHCEHTVVPIRNLKGTGCFACLRECKLHCSRCNTARYCGAECQAKNWPEHKLVCRKPGAARPPKMVSVLLAHGKSALDAMPGKLDVRLQEVRFFHYLWCVVGADRQARHEKEMMGYSLRMVKEHGVAWP